MPPELNSPPSDLQRVLPDFLHSLVLEQICNFLYPVGTIYITVSAKNPAALFGGTWVAWGSGRVPIGVDTAQTEFDTIEETGGSKTVTLTAAQSGLPAHSHTYGVVFPYVAGGTGVPGIPYANTNTRYATYSGVIDNSSALAASQGHSNLPPYITCYMWKRTA